MAEWQNGGMAEWQMKELVTSCLLGGRVTCDLILVRERVAYNEDQQRVQTALWLAVRSE